MKYFKVLITAIVISLGFIYILHQFAGFDSNAAIFIGSGTVVLSYVFPMLQKFFKEQRAHRNNI